MISSESALTKQSQFFSMNLHWNRTSSLILAVAALFVAATESKQVSAKPNVILIFADDLGPGLLGTYGQKLIKTPHIDRLATEGMKFNNYYGGVFCAPARWTLMTGLHDGRMGGWRHSKAGLPIKRDSGEITEAEYQVEMAKVKAGAHPIHPQEVFLGQIAQQAGYRTAQFGKLDRGFLTWAERVERAGWDFHEGYYDHQRAHGFYPPYLWRNGKKIRTRRQLRSALRKDVRERRRTRWIWRKDLFPKRIYRWDTEIHARKQRRPVLHLSLNSTTARTGGHS
jgi:arylsulfatase A-like enzyme